MAKDSPCCCRSCATSAPRNRPTRPDTPNSNKESTNLPLQNTKLTSTPVVFVFVLALLLSNRGWPRRGVARVGLSAGKDVPQPGHIGGYFLL